MSCNSVSSVVTWIHYIVIRPEKCILKILSIILYFYFWKYCLLFFLNTELFPRVRLLFSINTEYFPLFFLIFVIEMKNMVYLCAKNFNWLQIHNGNKSKLSIEPLHSMIQVKVKEPFFRLHGCPIITTYYSGNILYS